MFVREEWEKDFVRQGTTQLLEFIENIKSTSEEMSYDEAEAFVESVVQSYKHIQELENINVNRRT